ncbi:MAG: polyheme membrane-associated cytochrome C [Anaerolineae bacterium]|nr:polyheme membrane-associated cytochrome C [Anaerolineae bacterium]
MGATLTMVTAEDDVAGLESNLCINCHQGRSSTPTVDRQLSDLPGDEVSDRIRFSNIHYFAAGATLFGNDAQGAYQFADKEYLGRNEHVNRFDSCVECHDTHALEVVVTECADCHENVQTQADLVNIRDEDNSTDYDGDGDVTEGMAGEIATMSEALYAAMQTYSASTPGTLPILYDSHAYPYFFADADGNGEVNGEEGGYNTWTPNLLRAAYNYQYVQKDPGAFAHNGKYVLQFLYDSIQAVGGDTTGMTRP